MYQICFKVEGKKLSKKAINTLAADVYDIPKEQIESINIQESEKEFIYTLTVRG